MRKGPRGGGGVVDPSIRLMKAAAGGCCLLGLELGSGMALVHTIQQSAEPAAKEELPASDEEPPADPFQGGDAPEAGGPESLGTLVAQVGGQQSGPKKPAAGAPQKGAAGGQRKAYMATRVVVSEDDSVRGVMIHKIQVDGKEAEAQVILDPERIRERHLVSQGRLPEDTVGVRACKGRPTEEDPLPLVEQRPERRP